MRAILLDVAEGHEPQTECGAITGCKGCGWTCQEYPLPSRWTRFLNHIPKLLAPGECLWTQEDVELADEMHIDLGPKEWLG